MNEGERRRRRKDKEKQKIQKTEEVDREGEEKK